MSNFQWLLRDNYDRLHSVECRKEVLGYLREHRREPITEEIFAKKLTKVGRHIVSSYPTEVSDRALMALYRMCGQGVRMIRKKGEKEFGEEKGRRILESHFHEYAAGFAEVLFRRKKDVRIARMWYARNTRAISANGGLEKQFTAFAYLSAGEAARQISRLTESEDAAVESYIKTTQGLRMIGKEMNGKRMKGGLIAAKNAFWLARRQEGQNKKVWARNALGCYREVLPLIPMFTMGNAKMMTEEVRSRIKSLERILEI